MKLPRAILFDLDDTILIAFGPAQSQWQRTISAFADRLGPIEATVIATAIQAASTELWVDPARHKYWRHRIGAQGHLYRIQWYRAFGRGGRRPFGDAGCRQQQRAWHRRARRSRPG
jgi:FMN phosphatase YigB (HAD superfamily)